MLARISGTIESLSGNAATIAPDSQPGIAFEVLVPAYLSDRLEQGREITLHTLQYMESQNQGASFIPRLIGFASVREREFFELLTTVKGLGNKRALRAMATQPHTIARAIAERDSRYLRTLPEIGPKLAELIVHELKSKADKFALSTDDIGTLNAAANNGSKPQVEPKPGRSKKSQSSSPAHLPTSPPPHPQPPIRQTVDALVALGENPLDAERMVARALDRARAAGHTPPATPDELLTAAYATR